MLQMKHRKRIYYTEADKALMWDRWQNGNSLHEIARLFDRSHSSVRGILERTGGIRPPTRRRSSRSLTLSEREEISRGLAAGRSLRSIALRLAVHRRRSAENSTVTVASAATVPMSLSRRPGIEHVDPSAVNWH